MQPKSKKQTCSRVGVVPKAVSVRLCMLHFLRENHYLSVITSLGKENRILMLLFPMWNRILFLSGDGTQGLLHVLHIHILSPASSPYRFYTNKIQVQRVGEKKKQKQNSGSKI